VTNCGSGNGGTNKQQINANLKVTLLSQKNRTMAPQSKGSKKATCKNTNPSKSKRQHNHDSDEENQPRRQKRHRQGASDVEEVDVEVVDRESEASAVELDESEPIVVDSDEQSSDQVSFPKIRRACAQRTWDYAG
jgi:hypothetical protein